MQNDAWSDGNGSVSGRAKHALDVLPCDDPFWITHSLHLQMRVLNKLIVWVGNKLHMSAVHQAKNFGELHKTHIWFDSTHPECVEIGCICPHCVTLHSKVGTKQWGKTSFGRSKHQLPHCAEMTQMHGNVLKRVVVGDLAWFLLVTHSNSALGWLSGS